MNHSFDVEIATEFGLVEAIMIQYFAYWIFQNQANNRIEDFQDGRWWMYSTASQIAKSFPYLSEHQVRRTIAKLVEKEVLIQGNYNKRGFDRTMWYALGNGVNKHFAKLQNAFCKSAKSNSQDCKIQFAKSQNAFCESAKAIPINITQLNNTINNSINACNPIAMFEENFHFINQTVAERLHELEQSCGIDIVVTAIERTKQNKIPAVNAIKYIESTAKGIASGHDFAKRKPNDVVAAAEKLQQALDAERNENGNDSTKCDNVVWGVWADERR